MSRQTLGVILLLVVSVGLGLAGGQVFCGLFLSSIPPVAMSALNRNAASVAFTMYGAAAGGVIFLWALLAAVLAPLFRSGKRDTAGPERA